MSHSDVLLHALPIGQEFEEVFLAEVEDRSIYVLAVEDLFTLDAATYTLNVEVIVHYDEVVFVLFQEKDEEMQLIASC